MTSAKTKAATAAMLAALALSACWAGAAAAQSEPAWRSSIVYTADVTGVVDGAASQAGRYLDNLDVVVDGDLARIAGWRDARVHVAILANGGGRPNDLAGTLQGVDNIEVADPGVRLFEAWIEQSFADGHASVLAGLYDVNSEFYATEASGLLIAPAFGIGSEFAATGRNGPSIFPSTALATRVRIGDPDGLHVQAAAVNARASTFGDPDGVDTGFDDGVLWLAEGGWTGPARLALGAWRYDKKQEDIRAFGPTGDPRLATSQGVYVLGEADIHRGAHSVTSAFVRSGLSDGDTSDFKGGWQAGLLVLRPFAARPDSAFSVGVHQGLLSDKARLNAWDAGMDPATREDGLEITYSDTVGRFTLQPDLQIIRYPGGDRAADTVIVAAFRLIIPIFAN
ncbi:carbohydrate porin [Phenylobacterium sp.]|uniref:carbohydrate porin n=1 Tax=Phenylobacterium sp. TaxID=1871053 RepID=UPI0027320742|nr:carbohydrate porin [Phenylobacterium sp.]MDP1618098.1 carbohydrate porin [Phenylobacterium sp.]MDP1988701.1 carbohydrate porin [Phenylobacterium sp.]